MWLGPVCSAALAVGRSTDSTARLPPAEISQQTPTHCPQPVTHYTTTPLVRAALSRGDRGDSWQEQTEELSMALVGVTVLVVCLTQRTRERTRSGTSQRRWTRRPPGERLDAEPLLSLSCDDYPLLMWMHLRTRELFQTSTRLLLLTSCSRDPTVIHCYQCCRITVPRPTDLLTSPCSSW